MNKDWKGNSRAAKYSLAIKKNDSDSVREQDDFYATDPEALQKLIDRCSVWLQRIWIRTCKQRDIIWECACGDGNLAKCLTWNGLYVYATDLRDCGYGYSGVDFLQEKGTPNGCKIILTNPPYSLANEFILHALEILPEGGLYIALMNINCLAGIERYNKIFSKGSLREIYVFSKRIGCWKNNERDDKKAHIINYAWYVFQKGYKGQPTLYWL